MSRKSSNSGLILDGWINALLLDVPRWAIDPEVDLIIDAIEGPPSGVLSMAKVAVEF